MHRRAALLVAAVAGLVLCLTRWLDVNLVCGWAFIVFAAGHLVAALVLAYGGTVPQWWGRTAVGQALLSEGSIALGVLILAGRSINPSLAWAASGVGTTGFIAGLCIEYRALRIAQARAQAP